MKLATSKNLTILGILTVAAAVLNAALAIYKGEAFSAEATLVAISAGIGMILSKGAANTGGSVPSTDEAKARLGVKPPPGALVLFLVAALALPAPAKADFGVLCLSGCAQKTKTVKAIQETQLTDTLWLGPSVGVLPYVYASESKSWQQQIAPAFAMGLKWKPAGWTATKSLLALDLFASADFSDLSHVDAIPTLTFLDVITLGYGPRFRFASSAQGGSVSGLFAIGFSTSIGGP